MLWPVHIFVGFVDLGFYYLSSFSYIAMYRIHDLSFIRWDLINFCSFSFYY